MAIPVGRVSGRSQSGEPADLLLECHDRIRQHMRAAKALAGVAAGDPVIAPTAAAVHRYFDAALPLHSQDEDESVGPRLMDVSMCPGLEQSVREMTKQHRDIDTVLARLLPLWKRLAEAPQALDDLRTDLARDTTRLDALWAEHLELEEDIVFPMIAEHLDAGARARIVEEMRGRRNDK